MLEIHFRALVSFVYLQVLYAEYMVYEHICKTYYNMDDDCVTRDQTKNRIFMYGKTLPSFYKNILHKCMQGNMFN